MQLVAYGAQDIYLTGNPQITFFKVVYRRHTNFAMEAIEQVFMGNVELGKKTSCTITRNGDLIGRMYLEIDLYVNFPDPHGFLVDRAGHAMIDYVEIEIGGQCIDKQYGQWMDLWAQLTSTGDEFQKLSRLLGGSFASNNPSVYTGALPALKDGVIPPAYPGNGSNSLRFGSGEQVIKIYTPLQFWFNTNPGLALPLIALQYHEVKLNVKFMPASSLNACRMRWGIPGPNGYLCVEPDTIGNDIKAHIENISLYCDYIFLDTDERRKFAQVSHEYLIHQVQYNGKSCYQGSESCANIDLRFNHPVKEIVWSIQKSSLYNNSKGFCNQPFNYNLDGQLIDCRGVDAMKSAVIELNGHDRFRERDATYFRTVQPFQHHTGLFDNCQSLICAKGMFYCYSFALHPEKEQPSGTCNFSRIDNSVLNLRLEESDDSKTIKVYATNYNVLRIMSGMGGLAYSN